MSMSVSIHSKQAVEFKVEGSANHSNYNGGIIYPVVSIEFRNANGVAADNVNIFANIEQLMQIQKAITKAIRNVDILKAELEQKLI